MGQTDERTDGRVAALLYGPLPYLGIIKESAMAGKPAQCTASRTKVDGQHTETSDRRRWN